MSNDADTVPEPDALWKYVNYFIRQDAVNISAITANMDVQNRTTIVSKSQTVEFSSIVGIIKRTQQGVLGVIYAYLGSPIPRLVVLVCSADHVFHGSS